MYDQYIRRSFLFFETSILLEGKGFPDFSLSVYDGSFDWPLYGAEFPLIRACLFLGECPFIRDCPLIRGLTVFDRILSKVISILCFQKFYSSVRARKDSNTSIHEEVPEAQSSGDIRFSWEHDRNLSIEIELDIKESLGISPVTAFPLCLLPKNAELKMFWFIPYLQESVRTSYSLV